MANPADNLGKFATEGGPGRPKGSPNKATRHRCAVLEAMSPEDENAIWAAMIGLAKGSESTPPDVQAARLVFEYAFGKPKQELQVGAEIGLKELVFNIVHVSNESESLSDGTSTVDKLS